MRASVLNKLKQRSPIRALKKVQDEGGGGKEKSLFFSLNLTTLIDAFCILVIFLLTNMNGRVQELKLSENITLPTAVQSDLLGEGIMVRIEKSQVFLEDQAVSRDNLAQAILKAKKDDKSTIVIQADRRADYENIGLVLRAGGQAGFEKYVFAVLPGT